MATIRIKRHDTAAAIADQLLLDDSPLDLTGATVSLILHRAGTAVKRSAAVSAPLEGRVEYQLTTEDVANSGAVQMEWEVVFLNSTQLTYPPSGYYSLVIEDDLA